jgi:hypothetical protein
MMESTETSMSSPIMIDWLDFLVSTSMFLEPASLAAGFTFGRDARSIAPL